MTVNKEDVLKAVSNIQVKVEMGDSPDITYIIRKTTEATLNAVIAAIEAVNEPDPQNNREVFIKTIAESSDKTIASLMCRLMPCDNCITHVACCYGGVTGVIEWLKKEGATVEQFKDAFE